MLSLEAAAELHPVKERTPTRTAIRARVSVLPSPLQNEATSSRRIEWEKRSPMTRLRWAVLSAGYTLECGLCGGEKRVTRAEAEAYVPDDDLSPTQAEERSRQSTRNR